MIVVVTMISLINLITLILILALPNVAKIWMIPSLGQRLKQYLLSASSSALRMCGRLHDPMISFDQLHKINNRATPIQMLKYKHALLL